MDTTLDMEKIGEQFANLNIVKRSSGTTESTYLLGIDTSKTVQAEKGNLVAVLCSNGSVSYERTMAIYYRLLEQL